ncbi:hypothetical protein MIND_00484600 [Mycena indigotica]|uniref:Uncharacterized protein n=1 Tax=Mycena indigotica TaxID=2126181 RepID=A0A8H6SWX6_9AGAR|nr:uncharacterized protein MIND_00484600 [Mycena indigotica]KAF7306921.1 hypothetical protein MIND_00484600 [Mycena indigotica]
MVHTAGTHIVLGITIGLVASCIQSLGLTIQRKSHVLNEALPIPQQRVEHRRPLWLLGFAIFISSNIIGSLVQIAALPVVILAPLGAVSLLWNALFARILLGDVLSPWMVLGTLLIAGGAILIAVFGIVPEQTRSLEDLLALFRRPAFVVYFSLLGAVVLVSLLITHWAEYSLSRRVAQSTHDAVSLSPSPSAPPVQVPENPSTLTTGVTTTISEAITTERTPLLDRKSNASSISLRTSGGTQEAQAIQRKRLVLAISYASFSGILSGMCLLFAKSGVELLLLTIGGDNQFWRWQSWVLLLGLVAFALLQLWYLHKALIFADPILVCPSAFCFYNLSSIVNGLVYFNQFSLIPPLHLGLVTLGIVVLLCGVWVVSIQSATPVSDGWSDEESSASEAGSVQLADEEGQLERPPVSRSLSSLDQTHPTESQPPIPTTVSAPDGLSARRTRSHHLRAQTSTFIGGVPPVPNPVTTLGGGFQIGLSPVSPGFSIVRGERGRVVSGQYGFADIVEQARRERRRRTVSESDVRTRESLVERAPLLPNEGRNEEQQGSKARWRWLRTFVWRR